MRKYERTYVGVLVLAMVLILALPTYAAEISNISITNTTATSTTVSWTTDTETDATINYGLDSSYGVVRDPTVSSKKHVLTIPNLDPATNYHFQVESSDSQGNKSATAGFVLLPSGPFHSVVSITPPFIISEKEISFCVSLFDRILGKLI